MSCSDQAPCPIYLELSSVSSNGKKVALAGNLHGASVTLFSILLTSDDGGATWKEPAVRISGAALEQVQLLNSTHGWAAGETQVPLTRDPFFLSTTPDGAWDRKALDEDGTPGAVQRFWFDTPEHGELIVDSGQNVLYETRNGGESWKVVGKTKQAPKLANAPTVENVDYRLSTDNKSHAYVLEKREGEKWNKVASFPVQVASCPNSNAN
jgi:photosystem II stability/assembly factor-like uncharacterized protein